MTIIDNMKTNGALGEGVGPHRPRGAAVLSERSGEARALGVCLEQAMDTCAL